MSSDPQQHDSQVPPGEDKAGSTVWQQLREQLEQTKSAQSGTVSKQELAQRLADRAQILRQRMVRPQAGGMRQAILTFNKLHERYGILLNEVAAVETLEHFTPVPNAAGFIRGVIPWRGSILSLVDLGVFFGKPESGIADMRACVIVEVAGRKIAVVAHEVEEIISVREEDLAPVPDLPGEIAPEWIIGVHDENRLILRMSEIVKAAGNQQQACQSIQNRRTSA